MTQSRTALFLTAMLLIACAGHEGRYEPACIAYEGDTIELRNGRFVWDRFTDQRVIGKDGKIEDPFPDFPKTGTYSRSAGKLELLTDDGMKLDNWFYVKSGGRSFLLRDGQYGEFRKGSEIPECALTLQDAGSR